MSPLRPKLLSLFSLEKNSHLNTWNLFQVFPHLPFLRSPKVPSADCASVVDPTTYLLQGPPDALVLPW